MGRSKALLVMGMTGLALAPDAREPILSVSALLEAVRGEIAYFRAHHRSVLFLVPAPLQAPPKGLRASIHPDRVSVRSCPRSSLKIWYCPGRREICS